MSNRQDKLSYWQISAIISSSIIGVVVLTLPRIATENAKAAGVYSTFFGGLCALVFLCLIVMLSLRYPNQTVIEYSCNIFGKFFGKIFGLLIIFYTTLVAGVILRSFSDALKILLLQNTPLEVIMISMLFVTIYLIQHGIGSIAKVCESFFPLVVFALLILILLNYQSFDILNLRPGFSRGVMPIIKSLPSLSVAYLGFEVVYFLIPFMNDVSNKKKIISFSILGVSIPIIVYTALVGVSIGVFGYKTTSKLIYPTITLAREIDFPGAFAERFDIFFAILWILAAFTSLAIFFYLASFSVTRIWGLKNYRPFIFIILPIVYLIAILPQNIFQINSLSFLAGNLGMLIVFTSVPLFLLSLIRKKGNKGNV